MTQNQRNSPVQPTEEGKYKTKKLIVEIPAKMHLQIAQMKLDLEYDSMREIVSEALNDFFKKHKYPTHEIW